MLSTKICRKASYPTAQTYCDSGNFLWNSGMFVWRNDVILKEFEKQLPDHLKYLKPACAQGQALTHKVSQSV